MTAAPVSVITTVFNEAGTIAATIASLFAQTRPPDEVVVADAGSTDGTRRQLDDLAAAEPRLRVIHAPGNRSAGRNAAIRAATHDLLATGSSRSSAPAACGWPGRRPGPAGGSKTGWRGRSRRGRRPRGRGST